MFRAPVPQPSASEVETPRKKLEKQEAQIRSPGAHSERLGEADSPAGRADVGAPDAAAPKTQEVDGPSEEFNERAAAPDLEENGDIELARELVEIFLDDCPKLLSEIREAVERDGGAALERAAHTAKGALGYFSSGGAVRGVLLLQQVGLKGDPRGARETLAELEQSVEQLKPSPAEFGRAYAQ
jgi:HPt (histidine-containing phosphotransfer) domain-containing protein